MKVLKLFSELKRKTRLSSGEINRKILISLVFNLNSYNKSFLKFFLMTMEENAITGIHYAPPKVRKQLGNDNREISNSRIIFLL